MSTRAPIALAIWAEVRGLAAHQIDGLRYGTDGTDDRYPYSNADILHHLSLARGRASKTKKRTFVDVKIKVDPTDIGRAWLFDEHLGEYVPFPCTRRRYAGGLPLWLHERLKDSARQRGLDFEVERDMLDVRGQFTMDMELNDRGAKVVISQHPGRAQNLKIDAAIYAWRHLIESFGCKLKEFKRIAMRACGTDRSFEAMIYLAAAVINSR